MLCSAVAAARLFRCSIRVREEKKLAHLAGHIAGDGTLARPDERLVHIGSFQYPETANMLLGLGVWPIGDEHRTIGLLPHRLCVAGRGNSASELPGAGSDHFAVERVDLLDHRFGYGGRVEVVREVVSNYVLRHVFFSYNGLSLKSWAGRLPCLHHIVERSDGIRQGGKESFSSALELVGTILVSLS